MAAEDTPPDALTPEPASTESTSADAGSDATERTGPESANPDREFAPARTGATSQGEEADPSETAGTGSAASISGGADDASGSGLASDDISGFASLLARIRTHFSSEQSRDIQRAFVVARDAHDGQTRHSGEPYITHPVAVAGIVLEMGLDHVSVMGALLHDVLEDTDVSRPQLVDEFGETVAHVVDGLSKLTHLEAHSKEEAQAESFRKMLLAMVTDIRVILIKLADRLHNIRTIGVMRPDKQRRIGRETLQTYAPIAARLGMYSVKNELEDLAFRAVYPMRARVLEASIDQARRQHRGASVATASARIQAALGEEGINAEIAGRNKHLYSLYSKMKEKQLTFQRIFDLVAVRIVVDSADECYRVLGIVHRLYRPISHRFKDYIAIPKANGYRSLHTVLKGGSDGASIEVQIRTHDMDRLAESGIAAHWAYKSGEDSPESNDLQAHDRAHAWLSQLAELEQEASDTVEFVENVKSNLFTGDIYVFTPKGRIIQLPRGATAVDFAYAVHSQIGNTLVSVMVDRRLASVHTPLESGQTVEIICRPEANPSPMWLNSVVTGKARSAIRQQLRDLDRNKAAEFGERLLRRSMSRYDRSLDEVSERAMLGLLAEYRFANTIELFIDIGLGMRLPGVMAERLIKKEASDEPVVPTRETTPLLIHADEASNLHLARCCRPIPGDDVCGFFDTGRGVAVHRVSCRNVRRFRRNPRQEVNVEWALDTRGGFEVVVVAQLANRPGALNRVTATMALLDVNIENLEFMRRAEDDISMRFVLRVEGRRQLARIVRRLRNLTVVRSVRRDT